MLEKLHSGTVFDSVKNASAPKAASAETVRNGANFQSYYSSVEEQESVLDPTPESDTAKADVENTDFTTDVVDAPKAAISPQEADKLGPRIPEVRNNGLEVSDAENVVINTEGAEQTPDSLALSNVVAGQHMVTDKAGVQSNIIESTRRQAGNAETRSANVPQKATMVSWGASSATSVPLDAPSVQVAVATAPSAAPSAPVTVATASFAASSAPDVAPSVPVAAATDPSAATSVPLDTPLAPSAAPSAPDVGSSTPAAASVVPTVASSAQSAAPSVPADESVVASTATSATTVAPPVPSTAPSASTIDATASALTAKLANPANAGVAEQAQRSIAELRIAAAQVDSDVQQQASQAMTLESSTPVPGQNSTASVLAAAHNTAQTIEMGRAGQGTPRTANGAAQSSAEGPSVSQAAPNVSSNQPSSLSSVPQQNTIAAQVMNVAGQGQLSAMGLGDALQQMTASQEEASASSTSIDDVAVSTTVQVNRPKTASGVVSMSQAVQASQATMATQAGPSDAEVLLDPFKAGLMLDPLTAEPAGLSQLLTEAVMSPGTTHRPETPRLVAVQLAEALATKGERNIDVALNPEELGRVKMRVSTTETSVTVMITTERPETGELMRRHINELSEEFRRMGFEDVKFEFGGEGMSGQMGEGGDQGAGMGRGSAGGDENDLLTENMPKAAQQNLNLGETGLDMRI